MRKRHLPLPKTFVIKTYECNNSGYQQANKNSPINNLRHEMSLTIYGMQLIQLSVETGKVSIWARGKSPLHSLDWSVLFYERTYNFFRHHNKTDLDMYSDLNNLGLSSREPVFENCSYFVPPSTPWGTTCQSFKDVVIFGKEDLRNHFQLYDCMREFYRE